VKWIALLLFLLLACWQLDLPGLHYDEAKEAGLNAMELVTWRPLTAFRGATVQVGPWRLPLMAQDYIGSLNVLLAVPFLHLLGINAIALRALPVATAALTLLLAAAVARRLGGPTAAAATALLLAVNPSFVFWSRQGVFVTNLTALIFMASLWAGLRWWDRRRARDLWLLATLCGLGIYAKLLFVWAVGAMAVVGGVALVLTPSTPSPAARGKGSGGRGQGVGASLALLAFLLPLLPLILFNVQTGGTLAALFGNLGRSYYGVDNAAYLPNLAVRLGQIVTLLRGEHLWYLGGVFRNPWAPWALAALVIAGGWRLVLRSNDFDRPGRGTTEVVTAKDDGGRKLLIILALLALIVAQSAFTVSDLFITHYALLLPLLPLAGGLAFASARRKVGIGAILPLLALLLWAGGDAWTTARYHAALAETGGRATHSDAIYGLAAYLDRHGLTAPPALDWGIDAQVRFLTAGRVAPVEIFGYAGLDAADPGFAARAEAFLGNPDTVFLAHAGEQTVFRGRVEALASLAQARGLTLREEARFDERSGAPLFVIYRAVRP
jgi:hypothetical protein